MPSRTRLLRALDDLIFHIAVRHVTPPDQDVGLIENRLRETMLRLVERGCPHLNIRRLAQESGDRLVHALRINLRDPGVLLLVAKLAPNRNMNRIRHTNFLFQVCPFVYFTQSETNCICLRLVVKI